MEKRGLIVLIVLFLIIGFSFGYYYPIYKEKQKPSEFENSYISKGWRLLLDDGDINGSITEFKKNLRKRKKDNKDQLR